MINLMIIVGKLGEVPTLSGGGAWAISEPAEVAAMVTWNAELLPWLIGRKLEGADHHGISVATPCLLAPPLVVSPAQLRQWLLVS